MGGGPKAPPPPPPPTPPVEAPVPEDARKGARAREDELRRRAGRGSAVLGGGMGGEKPTTGSKTLLGQ